MKTITIKKPDVKTRYRFAPPVRKHRNKKIYSRKNLPKP